MTDAVRLLDGPELRRQRQDLANNGVICLRQCMDERALNQARQAYQWSLEHPGPFAGQVLEGADGSFYQDHANPRAFPHYHPLLVDSGLASCLAALLATHRLWLLYEQIWLKSENCRATPWHQDLPYVPLGGHQLATIWINLEPVAEQWSLSFVSGSHLGPLYNPTTFKAETPEQAMFDDPSWPPLPVLDDKISPAPLRWAQVPGDIIVFHPAILHGGGATGGGVTRRSLSLRVFGDDAHCAARPFTVPATTATDDPVTAMFQRSPGSPFRHPGFPRLV